MNDGVFEDERYNSYVSWIIRCRIFKFILSYFQSLINLNYVIVKWEPILKHENHILDWQRLCLHSSLENSE